MAAPPPPSTTRTASTNTVISSPRRRGAGVGDRAAADRVLRRAVAGLRKAGGRVVRRGRLARVSGRSGVGPRVSGRCRLWLVGRRTGLRLVGRRNGLRLVGRRTGLRRRVGRSRRWGLLVGRWLLVRGRLLVCRWLLVRRRLLERGRLLVRRRLRGGRLLRRRVAVGARRCRLGRGLLGGRGRRRGPLVRGRRLGRGGRLGPLLGIRGPPGRRLPRVAGFTGRRLRPGWPWWLRHRSPVSESAEGTAQVLSGTQGSRRRHAGGAR